MLSRPFKAVGRICLALMLVITLALLSVLLQGFGHEELPYGKALTGPTPISVAASQELSVS